MEDIYKAKPEKEITNTIEKEEKTYETSFEEVKKSNEDFSNGIKAISQLTEGITRAMLLQAKENKKYDIFCESQRTRSMLADALISHVDAIESTIEHECSASTQCKIIESLTFILEYAKLFGLAEYQIGFLCGSTVGFSDEVKTAINKVNSELNNPISEQK